MMTFPKTVEEFMEIYKVVDTEGVYMSKGAELVPIFRMRQWFEHLPSAQPERKKPVFKTGESVYHVSYADGTGGFEKTNGQIGLALIAVGSLVNSISHGVTISRNAITVLDADALLIGRMRI